MKKIRSWWFWLCHFRVKRMIARFISGKYTEADRKAWVLQVERMSNKALDRVAEAMERPPGESAAEEFKGLERRMYASEANLLKKRHEPRGIKGPGD